MRELDISKRPSKEKEPQQKPIANRIDISNRPSKTNRIDISNRPSKTKKPSLPLVPRSDPYPYIPKLIGETKAPESEKTLGPVGLIEPEPEKEEYTFDEKEDFLGIKKRLFESVTPIGYSPTQALTEFAAGERLPFLWDNEKTSFKDFEKHSRWENPEIGMYIKNASDDAWGMYLGFPQKHNTFKNSEYKKGAYSFNNTEDIWEDIVAKGFLNSQKNELVIRDSGAGGFTLKKYNIKKGFDKEKNLPYIEYEDEFDFDIPLNELGIDKSIPGEKIAGEPFSINGRIYYNEKTKEPIQELRPVEPEKEEFTPIDLEKYQIEEMGGFTPSMSTDVAVLQHEEHEQQLEDFAREDVAFLDKWESESASNRENVMPKIEEAPETPSVASLLVGVDIVEREPKEEVKEKSSFTKENQGFALSYYKEHVPGVYEDIIEQIKNKRFSEEDEINLVNKGAGLKKDILTKKAEFLKRQILEDSRVALSEALPEGFDFQNVPLSDMMDVLGEIEVLKTAESEELKEVAREYRNLELGTMSYIGQDFKKKAEEIERTRILQNIANDEYQKDPVARAMMNTFHNVIRGITGVLIDVTKLPGVDALSRAFNPFMHNNAEELSEATEKWTNSLMDTYFPVSEATRMGRDVFEEQATVSIVGEDGEYEEYQAAFSGNEIIDVRKNGASVSRRIFDTVTSKYEKFPTERTLVTDGELLLNKVFASGTEIWLLMQGSRLLFKGATRLGFQQKAAENISLWATNYTLMQDDLYQSAREEGVSEEGSTAFSIVSSITMTAAMRMSPSKFIFGKADRLRFTKNYARIIDKGVPIKKAIAATFRDGAKESVGFNLFVANLAVADRGTKYFFNQLGSNFDTEFFPDPTNKKTMYQFGEEVVINSILGFGIGVSQGLPSAQMSRIQRDAWWSASKEMDKYIPKIEKKIESGEISKDKGEEIIGMVKLAGGYVEAIPETLQKKEQSELLSLMIEKKNLIIDKGDPLKEAKEKTNKKRLEEIEERMNDIINKDVVVEEAEKEPIEEKVKRFEGEAKSLKEKISKAEKEGKNEEAEKLKQELEDIQSREKESKVELEKTIAEEKEIGDLLKLKKFTTPTEEAFGEVIETDKTGKEIRRETLTREQFEKEQERKGKPKETLTEKAEEVDAEVEVLEAKIRDAKVKGEETKELEAELEAKEKEQQEANIKAVEAKSSDTRGKLPIKQLIGREVAYKTPEGETIKGKLEKGEKGSVVIKPTEGEPHIIEGVEKTSTAESLGIKVEADKPAEAKAEKKTATTEAINERIQAKEKERGKATGKKRAKIKKEIEELEKQKERTQPETEKPVEGKEEDLKVDEVPDYQKFLEFKHITGSLRQNLIDLEYIVDSKDIDKALEIKKLVKPIHERFDSIEKSLTENIGFKKTVDSIIKDYSKVIDIFKSLKQNKEVQTVSKLFKELSVEATEKYIEKRIGLGKYSKENIIKWKKEAEKPVEKLTKEERRKKADDKLQEGLEDFLDAVGGRAKLAGEKRPDAIKALKKMVEALAEKGIIEAEAVIKELKEKVGKDWHRLINENRDEILQEKTEPEKSQPFGTIIKAETLGTLGSLYKPKAKDKGINEEVPDRLDSRVPFARKDAYTGAKHGDTESIVLPKLDRNGKTQVQNPTLFVSVSGKQGYGSGRGGAAGFRMEFKTEKEAKQVEPWVKKRFDSFLKKNAEYNEKGEMTSTMEELTPKIHDFSVKITKEVNEFYSASAKKKAKEPIVGGEEGVGAVVIKEVKKILSKVSGSIHENMVSKEALPDTRILINAIRAIHKLPPYEGEITGNYITTELRKLIDNINASEGIAHFDDMMFGNKSSDFQSGFLDTRFGAKTIMDYALNPGNLAVFKTKQPTMSATTPKGKPKTETIKDKKEIPTEIKREKPTEKPVAEKKEPKAKKPTAKTKKPEVEVKSEKEIAEKNKKERRKVVKDETGHELEDTKEEVDAENIEKNKSLGDIEKTRQNIKEGDYSPDTLKNTIDKIISGIRKLKSEGSIKNPWVRDIKDEFLADVESKVSKAKGLKELEKEFSRIKDKVEDVASKEVKKILIKGINSQLKLKNRKGLTDFVNSELDKFNTKTTDLDPESLAMKRLKKSAEHFLKNPLDIMPEKLAREIELLDKQNLWLLSNNELKEILDDIKLLKKEGKTVNRLKRSIQQRELDKREEEFINIISGGKGVDLEKKVLPEDRKKQIENIKKTAKNVLGLPLLTLSTYISTLGIPNPLLKTKLLKDALDVHALKAMLNSNVMFDILDEAAGGKPFEGDILKYFREGINRARDRQITDVLSKTERLDNMIKVFHLEGRLKDSVKLKIGDKGEELDFTRDQVIRMYMSMQDPMQRKSMLNKKVGNKLTEDDLWKISDSLTEMDKQFGNWMIDFYEDIYPELNKEFKKLNNHSLTRYDNYSPMFKEGDLLNQKESLNITGFHASGKSRDIENVKFSGTEKRTGSEVAINFKIGATQMLLEYILRSANYKALAGPLQEMNSVIQRIKPAVIQNPRLGKKYHELLEGWLESIANDGRYTVTGFEAFLKSTRVGFTRGVLGLNLVTSIKQSVSAISFLTELGAKDFAKGIKQYWGPEYSKWNELINSNVPQVKMRGQGGWLDRDIKASMDSRQYWDNVMNPKIGKHRLQDVSMQPIKAMDGWTVRSGFVMAYLSRVPDGWKIGDPYNAEAGSYALGLIERTQPRGDVKDLAAFQKGSEMQKLVTMFMNQPNQYYNIIYSNLRSYSNGRIGRGQLAQSLVYGWVVPTIAFGAMSKGFTISEEEITNLLFSTPARNVFVLGGIIDAIRTSYDFQASPIEGLVDEVVYELRHLKQGEVARSLFNVALLASQASGVPVNQLERTTKGIYNLATRETTDIREAIWSKSALETDDKVDGGWKSTFQETALPEGEDKEEKTEQEKFLEGAGLGEDNK
tara:strand:+ start:10188 stop:18932 length:8745 start_codon:yes stop_codon:yes gene_type:complete